MTEETKEITIEEMEKLPWVTGVFEDPLGVVDQIYVIYEAGSDGLDEASKYHGYKINGKKLFFRGLTKGKTWNGINVQ